jgi:hypothetical protein
MPLSRAAHRENDQGQKPNSVSAFYGTTKARGLPALKRLPRKLKLAGETEIQETFSAVCLVAP